MELVGSCVRGVCLPDAAGVPFLGVAVPDGESTYSNLRESKVNVTGPYERATSVRTICSIVGHTMAAVLAASPRLSNEHPSLRRTVRLFTQNKVSAT